MSEMIPGRTARVQEALARLEVDAWGIASVADMAEPRLRSQVLALLPEARSVVVFAMEVYREVLAHSRPDRLMGEASPRDLVASHMDYLGARLTKAAYDVARTSHRQGFKALPLPSANLPSDTRYLAALLSYKHAAEAAGLGTIGRHSLLVTPEFGPRVRLTCVLTEAELQPTPRLADGLCDNCNTCIQACPSHALSEPRDGEPYAINKFACSAFRAGSGSCAECMRTCTLAR